MAATNAMSYPFEYTESVSAVTATNSVALGSQRIENGKWYTYVYNGGTSSCPVAYGVIASSNSSYTVLCSSALGDMLAGVVVHNSITTATYGWVLTKGPATITLGAGGGVTPATLGGGIALQTNGVFTGITACGGGTGATGNTAMLAKCGVSTTAIAESGTGMAWILAASIM